MSTIPPTPAPSFGALFEGICASLESECARKPLLAPLFMLLIAQLRRAGEALDRLFAAVQQGTLAPAPAASPRAIAPAPLPHNSAPTPGLRPRRRAFRPRHAPREVLAAPCPRHPQQAHPPWVHAPDPMPHAAFRTGAITPRARGSPKKSARRPTRPGTPILLRYQNNTWRPCLPFFAPLR